MRAQLVVEGIADLATVAAGPGPRTGNAAGELARLDRAALAIDEGRFVFVGRDRALHREVRLGTGGVRLDLGGGSVVPGFVDAHTHLLFAGDRAHELEARVRGATYPEIARSGGGLFSTVRATRRASRTELLRSALARLARMASHGTTSVEVKSGYALSHPGELRLLDLVPTLARESGLTLVPTYLGAHAYPPGPAASRAGYVRSMLDRTLPEVARRRSAAFCDVFCEPGFFDPTTSERLLRRAAALGLGTKIHADEFTRSGGAALAARLRVTSADHLLSSSAADRGRLARAGVIAVLLPVTAFAAAPGARSPGRELIDAGAAVALGSDLSPNSYVESMPIVLAHAVYSARLTPAEAIVASTANAAHAIGIAASAGSIAVGRPADFAAFDLDSVEKIPYRIGADPVHVYRRGKRVSPS